LKMLKKHAHYRPHPRVQEDGGIVNNVTGEVTYPPSMTKQEFVKECDINNIIKQYSTTGMLNHISAKAQSGLYEDLPESNDFQESLHIIMDAEKAFMSLPSRTRERFHNEPANFLAFMENDANREEIYSLGLAVRPPPDNRGGDGGTSPPVDGSESPKTDRTG